MAYFQYRARNQQGQLNEGRLEAANASDAASSLMNAGLIPLELTEQTQRQGIDWSRLTQGKIKLEVLLILCRQFGSLTRAGIPILRIIQGLRDTSDNKRLKQVLSDIAEGLNEGQSLSSCLAQHPHIFNSLFISLVDVGESTGQLELAFMQLAYYFQLELDTRRRVKAATRYPSFVIIAMVIAMVVLNIFVIPAFSGIFAGLGAELPLTTRILIASSSFFTNYIWHLVAAVALISLMIWRYLKTTKGQLRWHYWQLRLPIMGPLINRILMARFCRSFAMMLTAGIPIVRVINLAGAATSNAHLTQAILTMGEQLSAGRSLSEVADNSGVFTPLIIQMFQVGEESGRVDEMVLEAGKFYEEQVDYDITNLTAKIEPILISVIAAMVLLLALGIFTPMWDMIDLLQT